MINECTECPWRWADHDGEMPYCHCDRDVAPCEENEPEEPDDTPEIMEENEDSSEITVDQVVKLFTINTHFVVNPNGYGIPVIEFDGFILVPKSVRDKKVLLMKVVSSGLVYIYTWKEYTT